MFFEISDFLSEFLLGGLKSLQGRPLSNRPWVIISTKKFLPGEGPPGKTPGENTLKKRAVRNIKTSLQFSQNGEKKLVPGPSS